MSYAAGSRSKIKYADRNRLSKDGRQTSRTLVGARHPAQVRRSWGIRGRLRPSPCTAGGLLVGYRRSAAKLTSVTCVRTRGDQVWRHIARGASVTQASGRRLSWPGGLNTSWLRNPVRLAGTYLDILQGRGSGTGWDMAGEVSAAMAFLKGSANPVIFDVGANHGEWTRGIWQALGTGRYYAYEPQSACQVSLASLQIPSLTIVQSGMSD